MTIEIKINCDNAAFDPFDMGCDGQEVARILKELARKIEANYILIGDSYSAMDANGNKVAQLILEK